jgi:hypothetical protein
MPHFSLTPCFSKVMGAGAVPQLFQQFPQIAGLV